MRVCEEQHLMRSRFHSKFMEVFQFFLHWSGIHQTKTDMRSDNVSILCNEGFFPVLFFIVKEKCPEDACHILCLMKNAVGDNLQLLSLYCQHVIENIVKMSVVLYYHTLVCICLCLIIGGIIMVIIWKLIWGERHKSNSPLCRSVDKKYDNHYAHSTFYSYNDVHRIPVSVDVGQENKRAKDGLLQQQYFSYSSFLQWIFLMVSAALFLSIPWEFMRLYQKAVSSHAAKVVKVISSVLTQGILHPLEIACLSLGRSLRAFFSEIPVQWQPFIMLLAVVISMLLLLMMCRYRLSIPLFLRIEPRSPLASPTERERSRKTRPYQYNRSLYPNDFSVSDDYDDECQASAAHKSNVNGVFPSSRKCSSILCYSASPLADKKYSSPQFSIKSRTALADESFASYNISSRNSSKVKENTALPVSGNDKKSQQNAEDQRKKQNKKNE